MTRRGWLALTDDELLAQCEVDRFRASGPGGQKRNKTESAVRLRHEPSGVSARAVESRSQHRNRELALERLRVAIAIELRQPSAELTATEVKEIATWTQRPRPMNLALLASLLDMLFDAEMSLRDVGDRLELSSAIVARTLRGGIAHRYVNQERAKRELGPLR